MPNPNAKTTALDLHTFAPLVAAALGPDWEASFPDDTDGPQAEPWRAHLESPHRPAQVSLITTWKRGRLTCSAHPRGIPGAPHVCPDITVTLVTTPERCAREIERRLLKVAVPAAAAVLVQADLNKRAAEVAHAMQSRLAAAIGPAAHLSDAQHGHARDLSISFYSNDRGYGEVSICSADRIDMKLHDLDPDTAEAILTLVRERLGKE